MKAIVIGSSMGGMVSAMALARAGVDVTILEADPQEAPAEVGPLDIWKRPGVPQLTQAHNFLSLFVRVMDEVAPGFIGDLVEAGPSVAVRKSSCLPRSSNTRKRSPEATRRWP